MSPQMQPPPTGADPAPLKHAHQACLAALVASALMILTQPSQPEPVPPADLTVAAICLGVGAVFARALSNSKQMAYRGRLTFGLLMLLCAAGVGAVGLAAALDHGARQMGLGLTLGGAILALRRPKIDTQPPH